MTTYRQQLETAWKCYRLALLKYDKFAALYWMGEVERLTLLVG